MNTPKDAPVDAKMMGQLVKSITDKLKEDYAEKVNSMSAKQRFMFKYSHLKAQNRKALMTALKSGVEEILSTK